MKMSSWVFVLLTGFIGINILLNISQRLGWVKTAPLDLPPGYTELHDLGNGWHTFQLKIGGQNRLFLRRLYPNYNNTESLTEIFNYNGMK